MIRLNILQQIFYAAILDVPAVGLEKTIGSLCFFYDLVFTAGILLVAIS